MSDKSIDKMNPSEPDVINFFKFKSFGNIVNEDNYIMPSVNRAIEIAEAMAKQSKDPNNQTYEYNSLIVFTGDRGSGKSTAMRTFVDKVKNDVNMSAFVLPIIDPTEFAPDENLIGTIVSHIYSEVVKASKNDSKLKLDDKKIRGIYECCDNVHSALKVVYTGVKKTIEDEIDSLESLEKLTSATFLRTKLHELFKVFKAGFNKDTLIIPIDDLDMKIKGNYEMLEHIRNFLFEKHVVVVMAAKLEQLTDSLEQHFTEQLKGLPSKQDALDAQPAEMASKYILKLIPAPHRIALPVLRADRLAIYNVNLDGGEEYPLVDIFLKMMWQKTGIVLVKNKDESHGLIPHNLRALHHMFNMLKQLNDVFHFADTQENQKIDTPTQIKELERNLNRIEEWVLDSACSNSVPRGLARIARAFAMRSTDGIHAFIVKELVNFSAKSQIQIIDGNKIKDVGLFGSDTAILAMLDDGSMPENISIGDALYVLNTLERVNPDERFSHFVAVIKLLYSIRMTRVTNLYMMKNEEKIKSISNFDKYEPLRNLLNGLVYNPCLRLTYTGEEWTTNIAVNCEKLAKKIDSITTEKEKMKRILAWRSLFFVGIGRIPTGIIHTIAQTHTKSRTRPTVQYMKTRMRWVDDGDVILMHFNTMAIINNLLSPIEMFAERVKYVFSTNLSEQKNEAMKYLEEYFGDKESKWNSNNIFKLFSLSSIDVLDELIYEMNRNVDLYDSTDVADNYGGVIHFSGGLKKFLRRIYQRTIVDNQCIKCGINNDSYNVTSLIDMHDGPFSENLLKTLLDETDDRKTFTRYLSEVWS